MIIKNYYKRITCRFIFFYLMMTNDDKLQELYNLILLNELDTAIQTSLSQNKHNSIILDDFPINFIDFDPIENYSFYEYSKTIHPKCEEYAVHSSQKNNIKESYFTKLPNEYTNLFSEENKDCNPQLIRNDNKKYIHFKRKIRWKHQTQQIIKKYSKLKIKKKIFKT